MIHIQNWPLVRNPQFLSCPHKTWWKWLPHGINIFIKHHEDRIKIVDFSLMAKFWMCIVFFTQTSHSTVWIFSNNLQFTAYEEGLKCLARIGRHLMASPKFVTFLYIRTYCHFTWPILTCREGRGVWLLAFSISTNFTSCTWDTCMFISSTSLFCFSSLDQLEWLVLYLIDNIPWRPKVKIIRGSTDGFMFLDLQKLGGP